MTSPDVAAIEARLTAATPGPWVAVDDPSDAFPEGNWTVCTESPDSQDITGWGLPHADAEFIAHAPADIATLLAEVKRLRGWLDEIGAAAGMGALADVANHLRGLGWEADHETRLQEKRVKKIAAIVMEEAEWRREVLFDTQRRAENAEDTLDRVRELHQPKTLVDSDPHNDGYTWSGCPTCGGIPFPCPTIRALDGEGE